MSPPEPSPLLRFVLPFLFAFSFFLNSVFALDIPRRPEGYVSDYAGMISREARTRLEETLRQFESETSNQVVVATFPSLEGEVLEDFSIRLAEAWKVGQKAKDNGVILIIFKEDRAVRIEVGYGLEGALTDALSKLIIENEIVPRFREGKFDEGIERTIQAILAATKGEYRAEPVSRLFGGGKIDYGSAVVMAFILGSVLSFLLLKLLFGIGTLAAIGLFWGNAPAFAFYVLLLSYLSFFFYFLFRRHLREPAVLSRRGYGDRGGSSWGSFGGGFGGGGSFGGGGASGRW